MTAILEGTVVGLDKCLDCGKDMRPSHALAIDWPGTVQRMTTTQCMSCHQKERRHAGIIHENPSKQRHIETPELDKQWVDAYVTDRRRRGIPPGGITMPGEAPTRMVDPTANICIRGHAFTVENTYWHVVRGQRVRECLACKKLRYKAREENRRLEAPPRPPKTMCRHGHLLTPGNFYVDKKGTKKCRQCQCAAAKRYRLRNPKPPKPRKPRPIITVCPQGHEYTPENTYTNTHGGRECRKCRLERGRAWRASH